MIRSSKHDNVTHWWEVKGTAKTIRVIKISISISHQGIIITQPHNLWGFVLEAARKSPENRMIPIRKENLMDS